MSLRFAKAMKITIKLAGVPVELDMAYADYLPLYENYICDEKPLACVSVPQDEAEKAKSIYPENCGDAYVEHMELCPRISNALLNCNRVFFHATAFVWREKAWLLTAAPGTGKTTQYGRWKMLCGDEVQMLNGDKPILECTADGIVVHHSPWRGKENMGQMLTAPLGGIILLEQAAENKIERLGREAVIPVYRQFMYMANRESVRRVFEIEDKMLRSVPVFRLYNRGDEASARLCRDTLEEAVR